jgi:hypothetical protein
VGHKNRVRCGEDRGIESRDPVEASRAFPIVLYHATKLRVGGFPTTLPMIWS